MRALKISLIASSIGTAAGFWAWYFNLTRMLWPEHPQLAGIFLTIVVTIGIQVCWPSDQAKT
jgi:hypothetical protein